MFKSEIMPRIVEETKGKLNNFQVWLQ
jgi:hypothetical protein